MSEFEAIIKGRADLKDARDAFDAFKKQVEQPIKITVDASGFNVAWGNLQKQVQSLGAQAGKQYTNAMQNNIKNIKIDPSFINRAFSGISLNGIIDNGSLMNYLGADIKLAHNLLDELTKINAEGGQLQKITFSKGGESFEAVIKNANTLVNVMGELQDNQWVTSFKTVTTDLSGSIKQAQTDAQKLADNLQNVGRAFSNGDFSANVATMAKQLNEISDTVSQSLVQKANDAANEYKRITDEIAASLANPAQATLQGQDLVNAYKQSEDALKRYRNAMKEVRADTTKMFAEGSNIRAANDVEAWAKKNSRALRQYGTQLELLAQQMRDAKSAGELSSLQNEFKNLKFSDYFEKAADSAYKYGQAISEVIDSTASWTRLGYNLRDSSILTDVTAELAQVGSGLDTKSATEGLQATMRGFGLVADEAKRVGDLINEVADTQPIDALGIINGLERSSAVMRETNNTLEETVGLITATTSVTQDATSAGTAWRTVALRIAGAKSELEEAGLETDGMVESTAKLRDYLMAVANVDILDETGKNFKSTYQIMEELSKVWGQLSDLDRKGILDKIAGKRGSVAVSSALQNWNIAESARDTALTADGSMDRQLAIYEQSIQASINKFKTAFKNYPLI